MQIILPEHINGFDRLFGGRLVEWIDIVAGVVARRHSNQNVTTASIDNLQFKAAAHVNSTVMLRGQITHVGETSMEVRVDTFVEDLSGERKLINRAYLVMVALDENEKPKNLIKRIIALPGETIEIKGGEVYIDGAQLREDYLPGEAISGEMDAVTVPEGQLFVMGDNREYSEDSRSPRVGTTEQSTIVGKVIVRLYPFNSIKTFKGVDYES